LSPDHQAFQILHWNVIGFISGGGQGLFVVGMSMAMRLSTTGVVTQHHPRRS
jgi:hypothetical protein